MDIHEMHVTMDVLLQKVNSNSRRNFLPEEKDLVLNWTIREMVSDKVKHSARENEHGFSNDEVDASALSTLLKLHVPVTAYPTATHYQLELPADFRNYIDMTMVALPKSCLSEAEALLPVTEEEVYYLYTFKVPSTAKAEGPYFATLDLNLDGEEYKFGSNKNYDPEFKRFVYLALKKAIQELNIPILESELVWEKFPNRMRQSNTIIWKSREEYDVLPSVRIDNVAVPITEVRVERTRANKNNFYKHAHAVPAVRIKPQFESLVESSVYEKSSVNKINVTVDNEFIYTPNGKSYIVTGGVLTYIKKPAEVNLYLGIDCDLPDVGNMHDLICSKAVAELLLVIDNPNWQSRFETNLLK